MASFQELSSAAQAAAQRVVDFNAQNGASSCTMVGYTQVVHDFKDAWNAAWLAPDATQPPEAQLAHNGMYDDACYAAIASFGLSAPPTCPSALPPLGGPQPPTPPTPPTPPGPIAKRGVPTWAWVLVGLLALVAVGGLGWYLYRRFGPTRALAAAAGEKKKRKGKRRKT